MQFFRRRNVRGRPPHPDVLTPAEWRVLEHIRERRTNAEIAVRLGVSVNTVRTHVSSMLAKLEVADREELARWHGEPALPSRAALEASRAPVALGPLAWLRDALASPAAKVVATGVAVTVVGAAIVGIASVASSMSDDEVEPTPAAVSAPTETPQRPIPRQATTGAPISIDGEFLVVVIPSLGSEQGPSHIERVALEGGAIQNREVVLDPAELGDESLYLNAWRNIHYPPRSAGDAVMAAVCLHAHCTGVNEPADPDARTALVRSLDRGATWDQMAILDGPFFVWSWTRDGDEAILWRYPTTSGRWDDAREIVRWPSMQAVIRPVLQHGTVLTDRPPMFLADDRIAWWTTTGLVEEQGEVLLDFSNLDAQPMETFEGSLSPDGQRLLLTWSVATGGSSAPSSPPPSSLPSGPTPAPRSGPPPPTPSWYWTLFERTAAGRYEARQTLVQPESWFPAVPYTWLDDDRVVIPASPPPAELGLAPHIRVGYRPAVVDFRTAEVSPIAGFDGPEVIGRGNIVIHIEVQ